MSELPNRVDRWAHPASIFIISAVGLALTIWNWVRWPASEYHIVIFQAIGLGFVISTMWKLILRQNVGYYAEFHLTPLLARFTWRKAKPNFWELLPIITYAIGLGLLINDSTPFLFVFATWIPFIILYPEQMRIYRAAQERLESLRMTRTVDV